MMRRLFVGLAAFCVTVLPAAAADPAGKWRVEDGSAHIRIASCDGRLWGVVAWEKEHGTDSKNPDPAKRARPTLGMLVVLGMRSVQLNQWQGAIYNAENGKTYQATMALKGRDRLEVEGCVMRGWVCSGEDWTRVAEDHVSTGATPQPDLCSILFGAAGPAHQGGLK